MFTVIGYYLNRGVTIISLISVLMCCIGFFSNYESSINCWTIGSLILFILNMSCLIFLCVKLAD